MSTTPAAPSRRVKVLRITAPILVDLLQQCGHRLCLIQGMPSDARIWGAQYDLFYDRVNLLVESDEFPEVAEGEAAPDLMLECHRLADHSPVASIN